VKNTMRAAVLATAAALVLAACGAAPEDTEETTTPGGEETTPAAETIDYTACIVSDAGGFDDKSFNQLSYEGAKKAAEELGADFREVQSDSESDFQPNLESLVAAGIIDQGVDVLLPVGGPIYQSAMDAIADSGKDIAILGVDADVFFTDPSTQDIILTSILKQMDVSVYDAIIAAGNGNFDPEAYIGTLENGGVGIAPLHNFEGKVDAELMAEVEALRDAIISGEVTVTSYLAQ
jgi:basic membrane lipoprotein Med (substrate-binding protein (PBP1-ABC) superfamily)